MLLRHLWAIQAGVKLNLLLSHWQCFLMPQSSHLFNFSPTLWIGSPHLVPHQLDIPRVFTLNETAEVMLHNVSARVATNGDAHTAGSIFSLNLDNKCAQDCKQMKSNDEITNCITQSALPLMPHDLRAPLYAS